MPIKTPQMSRDDLINMLCARIDQSHFNLLTQAELQSQSRVVESDWDYRLTAFLDDPENDIPNVGIARDLTRALLTSRYRNYVSNATFLKHTRLLKENVPKAPRGRLSPKDKARELASFKKRLQRT